MKRAQVLIVEDDAALAGVYQAALRLGGFDVVLANDGMAALWQIESRRPDVVVLDLSLPRLRGEAVLTELASSPELHTVPVIVVTGSDTQYVTQAAAVLQKPCDPQELVAVIERVCGCRGAPPL